MPRVTEIEAFRLSLPLVHAFQTSSHRKSHLEHILLRVRDEDGAVGWGEVASPSDPYYSAETVDICRLTLRRYLAPALRGASWDHPVEVGARWARIRGHNFAKAGLDIACWDLWSRAAGTPLARALGGNRQTIAAGVSLGIEPTIDDLLDQVDRYVAEGYRRIKLKIAPGWDVEVVRAVREAHPDLPSRSTPTRPTLEDQYDVLAALDGFGLLLIEQPLAHDDIIDHARLQARVQTAVCLDESIHSASSTPRWHSTWAPAASSTSRSAASAACLEASVVARPSAGRRACRSGAAGCTSSASAAPPTSRSPPARLHAARRRLRLGQVLRAGHRRPADPRRPGPRPGADGPGPGPRGGRGAHPPQRHRDADTLIPAGTTVMRCLTTRRD